MRNDIIVQKLIAYVEKILAYCNGVDYESFTHNSQLVEACVFNLSQIGELANRIDPEFTEKATNVPWKQIYGLRNRIVHDYEGVNLQLVWEVIETDLPELKRALRELL